MVRHLEEVLASGPTLPAVNQVEFSPYLNQRDLHEFCRSKGIQLEAYGSLTRRRKFKERRLTAICENYGKSPAQVLLRWALQKTVVVIPKSVSRERILENADVFDFEISDADMIALDSFDEDFRTSWNPTDVE
jgi:diketogulonate reductase-like aldo/keto reductase